MNDTFYKTISTVTIILMIAILSLLTAINKASDLSNPFYSDLKSVLIGIFIGLFFSFLLTIKEIRSYLLKSISNFMSNDAYLEKLSDDEVIKIKDKIANRINSVDVVSNKESLFN